MSKRRHYGREAWDKAVQLVSSPDQLPVVTTKGIWTAKKLYFLCVYLEQVVRGMSGHPAFPNGLTYVDLFCGCGVSVVQDASGRETRYPGSAVVAASITATSAEGAIKRFDRLVLVEREEASLKATLARVKMTGFPGEVISFNGDVNAIADKVVAAIPMGSLNIAFVDPYSLDIHYDTLATLARRRALDLVILFSDRIDLARNVELNYYPKPESKLDLFLGKDCDWRKRYDALPDRSGAPLFQLFADLYCERLATLGYKHSHTWPLDGEQGPMFRLVFASKAELGKKYCEIAQSEDFDRQRGLFG